MPQLEAPFRLPEAPVEADLVAKYFRGLGEPTRLRILELLRDEGELSVGALVQRLGVPQPKVSNHLACLRWCGFIEARREHRVVFNRIAGNPPRSTPVAVVRITLPQAVVMAQILRKVLKEYQEQVGPIFVPKQMLDPLGIDTEL